MDTILELLGNIKVIGPIGVIALIEMWAIYSLFNRLEDLQDKRIQDYERMKDEYTQLAKDVNSVLDTVLKVLGKKNGNDNGGCKNG
jgi:hypothetical protein